MTEKTFPLHQKLTELEKIEEYFQKPDMNLEEAIEKHKQALELAQEILKYLSTAESSLKQIDIASLRKVTNEDADPFETA